MYGKSCHSPWPQCPTYECLLPYKPLHGVLHKSSEDRWRHRRRSLQRAGRSDLHLGSSWTRGRWRLLPCRDLSSFYCLQAGAGVKMPWAIKDVCGELVQVLEPQDSYQDWVGTFWQMMVSACGERLDGRIGSHTSGFSVSIVHQVEKIGSTWDGGCGSNGPVSRRLGPSSLRGRQRYLALFDVQMSEKFTPLWRKTRFHVKMVKARRLQTTFGKVEMSKICTPLWRETRFQVKMVKTRRLQTTFWRSDVEKVYIVVARSTFGSQKFPKLAVLSLFWRPDVEKVTD